MDIGFLIDGAEESAGHRSGATYDRNDPYTGKLATRARRRRASPMPRRWSM